MILSRRNFIATTGISSLALLNHSVLAQEKEPKSIHTWLDSSKSKIYNYDIDVKIRKFPPNPDRKWLYYFSLQVNFTDHDEWSHGGLQWSGTQEFRDNNNKGINWGGGSDWAGYGGIGVTNTPFTWNLGKWYRYRVWRLNKETDGLYRWLFAVLDYQTGKEGQYGTVKTKSEWIKNAVVFTETGYGVKCDTPQAYVEWRNPVFRDVSGKFKPEKGTATYNGTCDSRQNTEQGIISKSPIQWFHANNTRRTTNPYDKLWG